MNFFPTVFVYKVPIMTSSQWALLHKKTRQEL